jgi:hypothetical protein
MACFIDDSIGLQACVELQFEHDTVLECAIAGDTTVPLHVNTGDRNPGNGVAVIGTHEPYTNRFTETGRFVFESRGYTTGGGGLPPSVVYIANGDAVSANGYENCSCHTRWPTPDQEVCQ